MLRHLLRRTAASTAASTTRSAVLRHPKSPIPISPNPKISTPTPPKTLTIPPPFSQTRYLHSSTYRAPPNPKFSPPLRKLRNGLLVIGAALFLLDRVVESRKRDHEQLEEILYRIKPLIDELTTDIEMKWEKIEEVRELIEGGELSLAEQGFSELMRDWGLMRVNVGELEKLIASYNGDEFRVLLKKVRQLAQRTEEMQCSLEERYRSAVECI